MDAHKNPNLETTNNHHVRRRRRRNPTVPSTCSQDFKKTHEELLFMKDLEGACDDHKVINKSCLLDAGEGGDKAEESTTPPPPPPEPEALMVDESGRERLKRHRVEMSGQVWIPDIWGQEDLLQKWIDCTVFDSSMEKNSIMSARDALIQEGRSTVRIENSC